MNRERGLFYTRESMRSDNRLPNEVWHNKNMRVEKEHAGCWRLRYLAGLRLTAWIRRGRT